MIEIFEGRLGGGKTYSAVLRILQALAADALVYTNVAMGTRECWAGIDDYCRAVHRVKPHPDQLRVIEEDNITEFHRYSSSGALIVLDEVHLWFNARDFGGNWAAHREVFDFLTQSRKYQTDIILITQSAANLDKQFARLVQYIWRFRDMSRFVIPGLGIRWPFSQIAQMRYDYDGKTMYERKFIWKDKRVFRCYNTNAIYRNRYERAECVRSGHAVKLPNPWAPSVMLADVRQRLETFKGWA